MKQMLPEVTLDHMLQNLLFLLIFLTSHGETLGLMLDTLSRTQNLLFHKRKTTSGKYNLGAWICFMIYNLLIKRSINFPSLMPCTSHFSFTRQWVKFSFQKSVVGEDKHLASLFTWRVLTGLQRMHVWRPACLRFRNATIWSYLIGTQNFAIL